MLLDFAEKKGEQLPSGCRVGQCESCAVRVLQGRVRHLGGGRVSGLPGRATIRSRS
ncbi:2Fe-2S iron-sulfur cluster binding domain-containing protein [Mesorhizobium sp. VK4C]|nr:2Fe-2S iron-sulfur cluster binding domain-containing protein [Mesorhizobium sp. VK4C]MDX8502619.1 2Fe-2S iron-sulfur cluster binding domain-containing protein [Mesorhizobium sp. VK4C]